MDIDIVRQQFINIAGRFLNKVEAYALGNNPTLLRQIKSDYNALIDIWNKLILVPIDELKRINNTLSWIENIISFISSIDVSLIATKMGVSDTSRGVIAQLQRDALDMGSKLKSAYVTATNQILKNKPLDPGQVETLIRAQLESGAPLGPTLSKIARRYFPLMPHASQVALRELVLGPVINRMLHVERIPIDQSRPIYEQVLTTGMLVPLTQSMSRGALFSIFDEQYDMSHDLQVNLAYLADKHQFNLIFVSKITKGAIEFDSRALFDAAFVRKNNLELPSEVGLNDKVARRYTTIRPLLESKAVVPNYIYHSAHASRTLILESLVGNLFRIIGIPGRESDHQQNDKWSQYLTSDLDCKFLVEGQSNRSDQYHSREEEAIFKNGQSDAAKAIVNIYISAGPDIIASDALRNRLTLRMREYMRGPYYKSLTRVDDIFGLAVSSLRDVLPVFKGHGVNLSVFSMFFARLFKLANRLIAFIEPYEAVFKSGISYVDQDRIIDKIMQSAADEELFTIDETLNMHYMRKISNS